MYFVTSSRSPPAPPAPPAPAAPARQCCKGFRDSSRL